MPTYRLTKLVRITNDTQRTSDFNYSGTGPVEVCKAWAEIQPMLAFERQQAEQIYAGATHRIVIRWPGVDISSGMRVEHEERVYQIGGVMDIGGEGEYLELTCSANRNAAGNGTTR